MASITSTWVQVNPSFVMPDILLRYTQASGAFATLSKGAPEVRIGPETMNVYLQTLDVRQQTAVAQAAANQLPGVSLVPAYIQAPTYLLQMRVEYNHHDVAAMGARNINLPEAYRFGMRQGFAQGLRNLLLYGFNAAGGEGLLNAAGATAVTLPADSFGNVNISKYDNGQLAQYFLLQIASIKTRTMQFGLPGKFTILMPQRIGALLDYQVVQLVQYQRQGAGSHSIVGNIDEIARQNGDVIEWAYDDTLIGKGTGGSDMIVIIMTDLKVPKQVGFNTNAFAGLSPNLAETNLMLIDSAAPMEIQTPLTGGATDVVAELRSTAGFVVRPEAVTLLSALF